MHRCLLGFEGFVTKLVLGPMPAGRSGSTSNELFEIGHDQVSAVTPQQVGMALAIDADDQTKLSGATRLDPRERVLDHHRTGWRRRE
jgi:hypothetical protein